MDNMIMDNNRLYRKQRYNFHVIHTKRTLFMTPKTTQVEQLNLKTHLEFRIIYIVHNTCEFHKSVQFNEL